MAQRDWRANAAWDGTSEPYTPDNDPELKYVDAELTDKGEDEARALLEHTEPHLKPQLLIVSPLRRATVTGLLAFEPHVKRGGLRVMAHELCHERAGRHTCDKRLAKSKLQALYPAVDYSQLEAEEDPFWADGWTREPWQDVRERPNANFLSRQDLPNKDVRPKASQPPKLLLLLSLTQHALRTAQLGLRAGKFATALFDRPEIHLAVAAHSAFLLAMFNAVFECDEEATRLWFGTGEMRTVLLTSVVDLHALDGRAYLELFGVQAKLSMAVATVIKERPANPTLAIAELLTPLNQSK